MSSDTRRPTAVAAPPTTAVYFAGHGLPDSQHARSTSSHAMPPAVPHLASSHAHMILAGLASGVSVAGLFNPWDRALYLSVLHSRPFLHRANFHRPYQGFLQVVLHRTLSGGLYFPLFDMAQPPTKQLISHWVSHVSSAEQSALLHFACGNFAGGVSGVLLNGLTAIKYASWDARTGFFTTARNMYRAGGYRPFVKGINATVVRDTCFGGVFAVTKFQLARLLRPYVRVESAPLLGVSRTTAAALHPPPEQPTTRLQFSAGTVDFSAALLAGLMATTASSPFNYVRNIKYGWPSSSAPPSSFRILRDLLVESRAAPSFARHVQERLRLGWGTGRVAVGMAVGQFLYTKTKDELDIRRPPHPSKAIL
jgi:hypothetical protein